MEFKLHHILPARGKWSRNFSGQAWIALSINPDQTVRPREPAPNNIGLTTQCSPFTQKVAMLEYFAANIPASVLTLSGAAFYSGRSAFSGKAKLYILGLNPGGDAKIQALDTIDSHTRKVLSDQRSDWSEYVDESWESGAPGTWGMQPRITHLLSVLGLDPRKVPASNLVFARSNTEATFAGNLRALADETWPFHDAVVRELCPKAVLCLGRTVGDYVRKRVGAIEEISVFVEDNNRRWRSKIHRNQAGLLIITATHPGRANWRSRPTDPSAMILRAVCAE